VQGSIMIVIATGAVRQVVQPIVVAAAVQVPDFQTKRAGSDESCQHQRMDEMSTAFAPKHHARVPGTRQPWLEYAPLNEPRSFRAGRINAPHVPIETAHST
jgi:hypothetical protein